MSISIVNIHLLWYACRTNKYDPISQIALEPNWAMKDYQIDKDLSGLMATIPLSYGGMSQFKYWPSHFCQHCDGHDIQSFGLML